MTTQTRPLQSAHDASSPTIERTEPIEPRVVAEALSERLFDGALATLELATIHLGLRLELYETIQRLGSVTSGRLAALTDRGWRLSGHPPLLLRPCGGPEPPTPAWIEVREVGDARTLADWERLAVEGYPFDELRPVERGCFVDERILADPHLQAWVVYVGDVPLLRPQPVPGGGARVPPTRPLDGVAA
jgi:hypothetical protein